MRDALPNASFIGFTGTSIEKADASMRAVFGDHISVREIRHHAVLSKGAPGPQRTDNEVEPAIRQIVSQAIVSDEVPVLAERK